MIEGATANEVGRMLWSFPVEKVRAAFTGIEGTREELCREVAQHRPATQITDFVVQNFGCCRQHVYAFSHELGPKGVTLPTTILAGGRIRLSGRSAYYLSKTTNQIALIGRNPITRSSISFLRIVKVEVTAHHVLVRFVTLERNIEAHVGEAFSMISRGKKEDDVLADLVAPEWTKCDLNAGIKALWGDDFFDATKIKFKKPHSTSAETMDEDSAGIKNNSPEVYTSLADCPLHDCLFMIPASHNLSVSVFASVPTRGTISFVRHSAVAADTDSVIRKILEHN
jgi:hypothetical protein